MILIKESWRLEETCCHSNSSERPSAIADVKNSQGVDNDKDNIKGERENHSKPNYIAEI